MIPFGVTAFSTTKWFMSQCTNGRQTQLPQIVEVELERPAGQFKLLGDLHQRLERDPLQRHWKTPAQRVQIDPVAVEGGDHGEAGDPAFRRLGLQIDRQAPPATEIKQTFQHSLHPSAQQGFKNPAHDGALFKDDVGMQQHVGLERNGLPGRAS